MLCTALAVNTCPSVHMNILACGFSFRVCMCAVHAECALGTGMYVEGILGVHVPVITCIQVIHASVCFAKC